MWRGRYRARGAVWLVCLAVLVSYLLLVDFSSHSEQPAQERAAVGAATEIAGSYRTAKRWLYDEVVFDRRQTFYCGCAFDAERRVDHASCGYVPQDDDERARRVEVEHVIPASWIGGGRRCWREPICVDADGKRFRGRECCERVDDAYQRAANDLHNLQPTVGEVNERRSNYRFAEIPGEAREFGRCDVEVDGRRVEPRPAIRGDIARIGLYMEATHGVWLSGAHRALFEAWDRADPPDAWERERNARIRRLQGSGNPFVERDRLARGDWPPVPVLARR